MSVGDLEFHKDGVVKSADIAPSGALDLGSVFVAHPTLSSHHSDILYLMAKAGPALPDRESTLIALDMKNMKMERVVKYTMQREGSMIFAYMLTTISKYLAPPGGTPFSTKFEITSSPGCKFIYMPEFRPVNGENYLDRSLLHSRNIICKNPPSMDADGDNMDLE
jgi:hypothetical protein